MVLSFCLSKIPKACPMGGRGRQPQLLFEFCLFGGTSPPEPGLGLPKWLSQAESRSGAWEVATSYHSHRTLLFPGLLRPSWNFLGHFSRPTVTTLRLAQAFKVKAVPLEWKGCCGLKSAREACGEDLFIYLWSISLFCRFLAFCLVRRLHFPPQAASWMVYEKQYHSSC